MFAIVCSYLLHVKYSYIFLFYYLKRYSISFVQTLRVRFTWSELVTRPYTPVSSLYIFQYVGIINSRPTKMFFRILVVLVNLCDSVPPINLKSFKNQFVTPRQTELANVAMCPICSSFSRFFLLVSKLNFLNFHCTRETANMITADGLVLFSGLMHGRQWKVKSQT